MPSIPFDTREVLLKAIYEGSVTHRRRTAQALAHHYGEKLRQDSAIAHQLYELQEIAKDLVHHMRLMALHDLCHDCASRSDGGCCSSYMAGETDGLQLLVNILLGIDIEDYRDNGPECCYLGPQGCIFAIKPIFCLNYNCHHILTGGTPVHLTRLEQLTGQLLNCQYRLEQLLLDRLQRLIKG